MLTAYTFYTAEAARDFAEALGRIRHKDNTVIASSDEFARFKFMARRTVKGKEQWVAIDPSPFVKSTCKVGSPFAEILAQIAA